jgi:hypothetical protein
MKIGAAVPGLFVLDRHGWQPLTASGGGGERGEGRGGEGRGRDEETRRRGDEETRRRKKGDRDERWKTRARHPGASQDPVSLLLAQRSQGAGFRRSPE